MTIFATVFLTSSLGFLPLLDLAFDVDPLALEASFSSLFPGR